MSKTETSVGGNPLWAVDASIENETYQLPQLASGRSVTIRRQDAGINGHSVLIRVPTGHILDGVLNGTSLIGPASQTTYTVVDPGRWAAIGGAASSNAAPISNPFEKMPFTCYGHSYAAGAIGSTSGTTFPVRLAGRLATAALVNNAVSGTSLSQIATRVQATWTTPTRGFVLLIGTFNSVQYLEGAATAAESVRAILATLSSAARYSASGTPIAYKGSWSASGNARRTTSVGDSCYAYSPTSKLDLMTQMSASGGGTVVATRQGDGAVIGTWSTNGFNPKTSPSPMVLSLSGITPGTSVKFTLTSGTGFTVDGAMVPNTQNPPAIVFLHEGPVITYYVDSAINSVDTNNALLAAYEVATDAVSAAYPNVAVGKAVDNGWDRDKFITVLDGAHPNDLGQVFLTDLAYRTAFSAFGAGADGLNFITNSPTITAATPGYYEGAIAAPDAPLLSVSALDTSAILTAQSGNTGGSAVTGYAWRYRTTAGPGSWVDLTPTSSATTTATGLTTSTSYDFQAAATNGVGTGPWSTIVAAAPAATYVYDLFNRADNAALGTSTSGTVWTVATGNGVFSQQAGTSAGNLDASYLEVGQANYTASATLTNVGGAQGGLVVRLTDVNHYILLMPTGATYVVYRRTNTGQAYTLMATYSVTPANGDVLSIVCNGTTLTVKVNGVTLGTITDSITNTATKAGIRFFDTTSRIDNFIVTP